MNKLYFLSISLLVSHSGFATDFKRESCPSNLHTVLSQDPQDSISSPNNLPQETPACFGKLKSMRVSMRHIEAKGIGYNQGYTTLDGFFALPEPWKGAWIPFLDLRGHMFNNGKPAANIGIGLRHLGALRIWGVNAYYDYRKTSHSNYNQFSLGLESLGKIWDFRINGDLPLGRKKSAFFDVQFDHFKDHYLWIQRQREFALKGVNAEFGAHVDRFKNIPLYFAAGPYCLVNSKEISLGGEAACCGKYL